MSNTIRRPARPRTSSFINPATDSRTGGRKAARFLIEQFRRANRRHHYLKPRDAVVAAVSGGPDSVALLALLYRLRRKLRLKLSAAHLSHGWNAANDRRARRLVERLCREWDVPCLTGRIRAPRRQEAAARDARYGFLERAAGRLKASTIVTAHTLDDQAETMLLRILRGTGLRGLSGIPHVRRQGAVRLARPLLSVSKADLLRFLKEEKIPFVRDPSNRDTRFTRNRLRSRFLPAAEQLNPQVKRVLASLHDICGDTQDYLSKQAARARKARPRPAGRGKVKVDLGAFKSLHPALRREAALAALTRLDPGLKRLTYVHIEGLMDLVESGNPAAFMRLPGRVHIKRTQNSLVFTSGG